MKVGNNPQARPQSGLDVADVVFEEVAEGGITRFLAVFNSTAPEQIGPVRSVRRMDPDLASAFGGIFAYSGGTPPNVQAIRNTPGVLSVDETQAGEAMRRDPSRRAPDNLYVLPEKMWEKGGEPVPPPALFAHLGEGEAFEGIPVTSARIGFAGQYAPTWTWDEAAGAWKRSYGDQPFTVQSGDQVTATNVVVQFVEYPRDSEGITVGEGDVWVFADGQVATGRWIRPDRTRPAELRGTDGNPLELVPGRTWVALLPVGSSVDLVTPPPPTTTAGRSTTTDR
ncbi:MAG: DUF3048 domain-containing protein [Acidimicrobiia bacterium]|nr:DUF3048 domain-containing protein [Acidimicrobiia bacterium]